MLSAEKLCDDNVVSFPPSQKKINGLQSALVVGALSPKVFCCRALYSAAYP